MRKAECDDKKNNHNDYDTENVLHKAIYIDHLPQNEPKSVSPETRGKYVLSRRYGKGGLKAEDVKANHTQGR